MDMEARLEGIDHVMELFYIILILCVCAITLAGVGYLIFRKSEPTSRNDGIQIGPSPEQVEAMRRQNSAEHSAQDGRISEMLRILRKIQNRFGFLDHEE